MPIFRAKNNVEVYKVKAKANDIHEMSGRSSKEITTYINDKIIGNLAPNSNDTIIDIGCGDGSLLMSLSDQIFKGVGIVPTSEEAERLLEEYRDTTNIQFRKGLSTQLPIENGVASKVISNGVMLLLDSVHELEESLNEIYRISTKDAVIWIGELPHVDENQFYGTNYGNSIVKWLMFLLDKRGFRAFFRGAYSIVKAICTKKYFIISPKNLIYMEPDEFVELCEKSGFTCVEYEKTRTKDILGKEIQSLTRFDYIFRKKINNIHGETDI